MLTVPFRINRPYADVDLLLELFSDNGRHVCGIYKLRGRITLPPRRWLKIVRAEVKTLENIARAAGCAEMRIAGRSWARILPDYQPFAGVENGLRKAL